MKTELEYYDIYPKVVCTQKEARITIKPLGSHVAFAGGKRYRVRIVPMNETLLGVDGAPYPVAEAQLQEGCLCFSWHFLTEQQYMVVVLEGEEGTWKKRCELRVYALRPDFFALRPYMGDMHSHTDRSDGKEGPEIVAANYRRAGFDFLAVTDHGLYEPSLEAIQAYEGLDLSFRLFCGEEVHPPKNHCHTIHFGGSYSVNQIFREEPQRYEKEVGEIAAGLGEMDSAYRQEYASLLWVYREIKKAGGLAVMVHPCWIQEEAYHMHMGMYRRLLSDKPFDAIELTGGQTLEENQLQVSLWQQMREEGNAVPIVGSSDSHGTVNAEWFEISKMIVLAGDCSKDSLIEAVKQRRVAVLEQYKGEKLPRLYGENRTVEFVLFLLDEYMPLHDALCFEEGRLMKEYACGDKEAGKMLQKIGRRTDALAEKYWA